MYLVSANGAYFCEFHFLQNGRQIAEVMLILHLSHEHGNIERVLGINILIIRLFELLSV